MQAVTALAHLKAAILFIMDVSEMCDKSVEDQIKLFESIQPLFANKPVFIGLNKSTNSLCRVIIITYQAYFSRYLSPVGAG